MAQLCHTIVRTKNLKFILKKIHNSSILMESLNLHVGMSVGMNLNAEENISFPIEAGFRYNFYADFVNYEKIHGLKSMFSLMGPEGYASIGVTYRFNESQPAEAPAASDGIK